MDVMAENGSQKDVNGIELTPPQSAIPLSEELRSDPFRPYHHLPNRNQLDSLLGGVIQVITHSRLHPHWSRSRDLQLRDIYRNNDAVKIAVYNVVEQMVALKPVLKPVDAYNDDARVAAMVQQHLLDADWYDAVTAFLVDVFTQDNGGFIEVLGYSSPSSDDYEELDDGLTLIGPLKTARIPGTNVSVGGVGMNVLDSADCCRTRHPDYPVMVKRNGRWYALHRSRVIYWAELPSSEFHKNGIGFCALSRAVENAYQYLDAENILARMLRGEALRSILFCAPWDGHSVLTQYEKALYSVLQRQNDGTIDSNQRVTPVAVVGMPPEIHENVGSPVTEFTVQQEVLEILPEGYDKWTYQTEFMKILASSMGVSFRQLGLEARFGGRTDAEQSLRITNTKFARKFSGRMAHEISNLFCTMDVMCEIPFIDHTEEKEKFDARFAHQRERLAEAQADQLNLLNQTADVQYLIDRRLARGDMTENEAQRILDEVDETSSPTGIGGQNVPIVEEGDAVGKEYQTPMQWAGVAPPPMGPLGRAKRFHHYETEIKELARRVWRGEMGGNAAETELRALMSRQMASAFQEGFDEAGLLPGEISTREASLLESSLRRTLRSAPVLINYLQTNSRDAGEPLTKVEQYVDRLWVPRYDEYRNHGLLTARDDLKLRWNIGPRAANCDSCVKLDGTVKRASTWREANIRPKMAGTELLECGGFSCGCEFTVTSQNVTPGPLPSLP